ncbi:glycerol-3-phosphate dehydrogenase subunit GlpB [Sansalvadorimonas sp. 2012CJ34-2]|uniref:Glycerol-3-phosphate dehydrogenase subunit GlpB n=1 Tax=Parendozoicomonas callyspongiae TaxID=2942213 RepID=A0ABT0PJU9_9GAMM|nr:glycerol-3-phosphate dehydrogenase subunit GlpB [Sansalvadorimonas sp. 2012CJ34-2]MCL6271670.1 glycerol-3-phosphate dehydrogenase subunit GlpB [Sansalvadorimonas sp. 2012CJ34-2]
MKHDCLVIGGGLAGLTAGIRCAEAGLKVTVLSSGESALTFSSGAIDVLGMDTSGMPVRHPFQGIGRLIVEQPDHPYALLGGNSVYRALDWFQGQVAETGLKLVTAKILEENHWRLTAAGALRPAWLSQPTAGTLDWDFDEIRRVVFVNFTGFLDFMPELASAGLKTNKAFEHVCVSSLNITLPLENGSGATADTMRSTQLARAIGESDIELISSTLLEKVGDADLVAMPACLNVAGRNWLEELRRRTGLNIIEVATLPPSVHGIGLLRALRSRFAALGGFYVPAVPVKQGVVSNGRVESVQTPDDILEANHYILTTGSYFSKGMTSKQQGVSEPVFGLDMQASEEFCDSRFLAREGHGFNRTGVVFNKHLQPSINGQSIENLHVAGALLAGYDPIIEGSGGGVAISTAWKAAGEVIEKMGL